jgi:hypothetical protein
MTNQLLPQPTQRTNTTNMGASQGKSKKEQKEEAREWARTKENEVAELYAQNTELRNQILMMQEDMRALRDMLKGQQSALNESVKQMNERMTEMENDVKVVPFEWNTNTKTLAPVIGKEVDLNGENFPNQNVVYSATPYRDTYGHTVWHDIAIGVRVMSLSQYEKIHEELKYVKFKDVGSINPETQCGVGRGREIQEQMKASDRNFEYSLAVKKSI